MLVYTGGGGGGGGGGKEGEGKREGKSAAAKAAAAVVGRDSGMITSVYFDNPALVGRRRGRGEGGGTILCNPRVDPARLTDDITDRSFLTT